VPVRVPSRACGINQLHTSPLPFSGLFWICLRARSGPDPRLDPGRGSGRAGRPCACSSQREAATRQQAPSQPARAHLARGMRRRASPARARIFPSSCVHRTRIGRLKHGADLAVNLRGRMGPSGSPPPRTAVSDIAGMQRPPQTATGPHRRGVAEVTSSPANRSCSFALGGRGAITGSAITQLRREPLQRVTSSE